jgi:hypothetical protein
LTDDDSLRLLSPAAAAVNKLLLLLPVSLGCPACLPACLSATGNHNLEIRDADDELLRQQYIGLTSALTKCF